MPKDPQEPTQGGRVAGAVPRRSSRGRLAAAGGNVISGIYYLGLKNYLYVHAQWGRTHVVVPIKVYDIMRVGVLCCMKENSNNVRY